MVKTILKKRILRHTKTTVLLDEYESKGDNNEKIYDALMLEDVFCIRYRRKMYFISLLVERRPKDLLYVKDYLTFTEFKNRFLDKVFTVDNRNDYEILNAIFNGMAKLKPDDWDGQSASVTFSLPVEFDAQNSSNRSGYGNRYRGEELVYEGTLYGEVTHYMFTGVQFRRWVIR